MDDVIGYTQLYYKFRSGYKLFLVDVNINVCDYITNKTHSKIIELVLPTLRNYLKLDVGQFLECPFIGRLDVINFPLTSGLFNNMFIPVGDYMVNLTATTNEKEMIWNGKFYFNIPEGKIH